MQAKATLSSFLLCFLFVSAGYPQFHLKTLFLTFPTPPKQLIQKNKIHKEFVYDYDLTTGKPKDSTLSTIIEFDSLGNIARETDFRDSGIVSLRKSYEYHEPGKVFCILSEFNYPKPGFSRQQFFYDSAGNERTNYTFNEDTTYIYFQKKIYDEKNRLVVSYVKPGNEELRLEKKYAYADNGDLNSEEFYDTDGKLQYSYSFERDISVRSKTVYKKVGAKKRQLFEVYFYDTSNVCIRSASGSDEPMYDARNHRFIGNESVPRIDHYLYNPNGTLAEWDIVINKTRKGLNRYYYISD